MECLLPLFTVMILCPVVALLRVGRQAQHIKAEGEFGDVLVLILFWQHAVLFDVIVRKIEHLTGVGEDATMVCPIAYK
jgi:hypothetical protein